MSAGAVFREGSTRKLEGKTAWITGAGGALGREISVAFAREGADLVLCDNDKVALDQAVYECSKNARKIIAGVVDVTEEGLARSFYEKAVEKTAKIDVLVNNAGIHLPEANLWEVEKADFQRILEVNLLGAWICSKLVIPGMRERKYGRIVNVTSALSVVNMAKWGPYSCSKAGLNALTRTLAEENKGLNILVNGVEPGMFHSRMHPEVPVPPTRPVPDVILCATLPQRSINGRFVFQGKDTGW
jgi:NAD(P)-dependent dehydrogenase (short-subunit alcohol dehydrogenase family)